MRRILMVAASCLVLSAGLEARAQSGPVDLSSLPAVIKDLKWKTIDTATLTMADRCAALLLLNDALDEIGGQAKTEADLMSQYIDEQNMGPDFTTFAPPAGTPPLTYSQCLQVAVAMLRGPLSTSSYTTQYATETDQVLLKCTAQMYESTCQRKWSDAASSRSEVRWMSQFLEAKKKMAEYKVWAPLEVQRREEAFQKEMAQRRAAAIASADAKRAAALEKQAQEDQAAAAASAAQMQQAISAAQQSQSQSNNQSGGVVVPSDGSYPDYYYGGITGLGAAAYYRDRAYQGAAGARVENRMSGWRRGGGGRGGRR